MVDRILGESLLHLVDGDAGVAQYFLERYLISFELGGRGYASVVPNVRRQLVAFDGLKALFFLMALLLESMNLLFF